MRTSSWRHDSANSFWAKVWVKKKRAFFSPLHRVRVLGLPSTAWSHIVNASDICSLLGVAECSARFIEKFATCNSCEFWTNQTARSKTVEYVQSRFISNRTVCSAWLKTKHSCLLFVGTTTKVHLWTDSTVEVFQYLIQVTVGILGARTVSAECALDYIRAEKKLWSIFQLPCT